jgi:hypothetical protein
VDEDAAAVDGLVVVGVVEGDEGEAALAALDGGPVSERVQL